MKVPSLDKKLKNYLGLAGALVGSAEAGAQINYTDIDPDSTVSGNGSSFALDLNGDSYTDYTLVLYDTLIGSDEIASVRVLPYGNVGNRIAGETGVSYNYPFRLNAGASIDANTDFLPANAPGELSFVINGNTPYDENWNGGVTDGYLGFRIRVVDSIYYGWARLDIDSTSKSFTIKDYAVTTEHNQGIPSGVMNTRSEKLRGASIVQRGNRFIPDFPQKYGRATIRLVDMTGRELYNEKHDSGDELDFSHLPAGLYLVHLEVEEGRITEKVMIGRP